MTLIEKIRKDWIAARKAKTDQVKALGFLYAEAVRVGKDKQRETTDDEVIRVVKKLLAKNAEMHKLIVGKSSTDEVNIEHLVLEAYLPQMADEQDVRAFITLALASDKNIGQIMGGLKQAYGETVDMKFASGLIKALTEDA